MGAKILGVLLVALAVPANAQAANYVIEIRDMAFGPAPAHLAVGDVITWKNSDIFRHTATDKAGGFDLMLPPGASAQADITKAGVLNVFCRYHPTMHLRLHVAKAS